MDDHADRAAKMNATHRFADDWENTPLVGNRPEKVRRTNPKAHRHFVRQIERRTRRGSDLSHHSSNNTRPTGRKQRTKTDANALLSICSTGTNDDTDHRNELVTATDGLDHFDTAK